MSQCWQAQVFSFSKRCNIGPAQISSNKGKVCKSGPFVLKYEADVLGGIELKSVNMLPYLLAQLLAGQAQVAQADWRQEVQ